MFPIYSVIAVGDFFSSSFWAVLKKELSRVNTWRGRGRIVWFSRYTRPAFIPGVVLPVMQLGAFWVRLLSVIRIIFHSS